MSQNAQELINLLFEGLKKQNIQSAKTLLGDRSTYVGLSDIGKSIDCLRAVVLGKLTSKESIDCPKDLSWNEALIERELRLQRGHWFERGVNQIFTDLRMPVLPQLEISANHEGVPIKGHLDFVFVNDNPLKIQIVELKSCENIPLNAYSAHEMQLFGQIGLLKSYWDKPCFSIAAEKRKKQAKITFPELVKQKFSLDLPGQSENVPIEGLILCLSMNKVKVFGPYHFNEIAFDICLSLAGDVWENMKKLREGTISPSDLPTAKGWNPLCDFCEWNLDCPRFAGITALELEDELKYLQSLKREKEAISTLIQDVEKELKMFCKSASPELEWISAQTLRMRLSICEGKRTLNKDLLKSQLEEQVDSKSASELIENSHMTGKPYERLLLSAINIR